MWTLSCGKVKKKTIWKNHKGIFSNATNPHWYMWPNECEGKTWRFLLHHIYRWLYMLWSCLFDFSQVWGFRWYKRLVENQLDKSIKALRTDRGCKYLSEQFKELCDERGIARQLMMPYTPQQNGMTEMRNWTLLEMVRLMMVQANLLISYWGDALLTAAYILN